MRFILFCLTIFFYSTLSAQEIQLSEIESKEIVQSKEVTNFWNSRKMFLIKIDEAVKGGISIDSLKKAAIIEVSNPEQSPLTETLFGSRSVGDNFYKELSDKRQEAASKILSKVGDKNYFICNSCHLPIVQQINYLFENYKTFLFYMDEFGKEKEIGSYGLNPNSYKKKSSKANILESGNGNYLKKMPTCGSWWNQIKLVGCTGLCTATTVGLGAGLCGWGCWCTFCTKNSEVAKVICAD